MRDSSAVKHPPANKAKTRRSVLLAVPFLLAVGAIPALCLGISWRQAILASAVGVISGQAGWWTFHLVSGRNDGLFFLIFPMTLPVQGASESVPLFSIALLVRLIFMVPLAWICGRMIAAWDPNKPAPNPRPPLHDSQLDGV